MADPRRRMQHRREDSAGLLQRIGDPDYRLPGENPATTELDDARRWMRTYERLIKFKRELLELCHKYAERAEPEVARIIRDTDVVLLEVQLSRFEQRHDYWKIRATELAGSGRHGGAC